MKNHILLYLNEVMIIFSKTGRISIRKEVELKDFTRQTEMYDWRPIASVLVWQHVS